jgi:hypothetical protein
MSNVTKTWYEAFANNHNLDLKVRLISILPATVIIIIIIIIIIIKYRHYLR